MKSELDKDWVELSKRITTMSPAKCLDLLKKEVAGKRRGYVIERLYGIIRKALLKKDHLEMKKGRLPQWLNHI